jgi:diguanylate cyclase (GGDEF)-like protein
MEGAPTPETVVPPLDPALLAAAMKRAASAAGETTDAARAIDNAVGALHAAVGGLLPSVFLLEHGRLWLVSQRGYAAVPDGLRIESGITGRAVRLGEPQLVLDVRADPDYVDALPAVRSEVAVPLRAGGLVVGLLNVESERVVPDAAVDLVQPLASVLAPLVQALRSKRTLDLGSLARLFVHLGSLRDPHEIAGLAAASLARVLPVSASQVVLWDLASLPAELASWRADGEAAGTPDGSELVALRERADTGVVCQLLPARHGTAGAEGTVAWLPLRASGEELGVLVGVAHGEISVDPTRLDAAAVLAAHVGSSLDAALALQRERLSALTDPLTGVLNRRGLEQRLERDILEAQEQRLPLSVLVIDCDDFKDVNDRAGHEFGDALLREVADALVRSVPEGAGAARLGGDEFVVVLPGSGADAAKAVGTRIRELLARGLTDAGFPLRISVGLSTYPFDGATPTILLRTADQALYAAKAGGKDRVATFRDVARRAEAPGRGRSTLEADDRRGAGRRDASVLAEAIEAASAIEAEDTVDGVCDRLCKALVFVVGATACSTSRVVGDLIVDTLGHSLREVSLGHEVAYRIADFPLTEEVLRTGRTRTLSFLDEDVDPAEAFILRELGMNAVLILPLHVAGEPWGLVELYEMRLRRFSDDAVAVAQFLAGQAERRLAEIGAGEVPSRQPPVYELPSDAKRRPRTR